ncbi:MAG: ABC transporter permease [Gemmataceae bacterium]|nr:ABC transporter permease [Gemmataceae bacterium]
MPQTDPRLRYRPWRGTARGPLYGALAMARASLKLMLRRWLTWGLFGLALLVFFFFFYAQYLMVWITNQLATESVRFAGIPVNVQNITRFLDRLALNGTDHTFGNFIWFQGYVLVIALSLSGSVLVGNDFANGSLPFYLSKPISRWHYVLGKCLAVGGIINLLTTLPAVILWVEAGLLYDWKTYYFDNILLLVGIIGYGATLSVTLGLLTVATAVLVRRTVPMAMIWMGLFVLLPMLSGWLVDTLKDEHWRLLDLWNNLYLCGLGCLGTDPATIRPAPQPAYWEAWAATGGVVLACLAYLRRRIQAVEVVG